MDGANKYMVGKPPTTISDKYNIDLSIKEVSRLQFTKCSYRLPLKYDKLRLTIHLSSKSKLYKILSDLDDIMPKMAYENRKIWFSEDLWDNEPDIFVNNYHKILQPRKDNDPEDEIDVKDDEIDVKDDEIDVKDDEVDVKENGDEKSSAIVTHFNLSFNLFFRYNNLTLEVYDENGKIIKDQIKIIQELGFGDYKLSGLFRIKSIWFNCESYGVSLELHQIKMYPYQENPIIIH